MQARLFWKLGLTYLALLLAVLLAVDIYAGRALRRDYLRAAKAQLASLAQLVKSRPPDINDPVALRSWAEWMAGSGARVTVITADGRVLADSAHDPETMENHANRPEFQEAMAKGEGSSIRHSHTLDRDLVYFAFRHQPRTGPPVVLRLALPLAQINLTLSDIRRRLLLASLLILVLGGASSLLFSRAFSARVERLKDFSRRVAAGDFRPLPGERPDDEITELGQALNETAAHLDGTIRALTDERNRSAAILRSMVEGVAVIDVKGRLVFCNRAFLQILGLDAAASYEGRPLLEVIRQPGLLEVIREALGGSEAVQSEVTIGTVQPRNFAVTAAPISALGARDDRSALAVSERPRQGAVMVLHDISELRRLERVRRDFVANVSHEFKTPLTAIQGFAETLLGGALEDKENNRRFLEIIRDHSVRLARLTDDLLKLARIEAGKLDLEFRPISLADIVGPCIDTTRLKAARKELALEIDSSAGWPVVRGDAANLREALQNLLDNAVQYTPPGGRVSVRVAVQDRQAILSVKDTGIGIPQLEQARIFERFYRVDAARSRDAGGTGLGLSIAKHIVEAHGGRLWVESAVGQGSQFHFTIPLAG